MLFYNDVHTVAFASCSPFLPLSVSFACADEISREWDKKGVGGESEEVRTVVEVLTGPGI